MTTEEQPKKHSIAEVLIATGIKMAQEQQMNLAELIGHFQIATFEVFNRNVAAHANAQNQSSEPAEGGDTEKPVDFDPNASEDKVES